MHKVEWQGYNTKLAYDHIFIVVPQSSPVQSSPVQSSPVQSTPVQSSPVQSSPHFMLVA